MLLFLPVLCGFLNGGNPCQWLVLLYSFTHKVVEAKLWEPHATLILIYSMLEEELNECKNTSLRRSNAQKDPEVFAFGIVEAPISLVLCYPLPNGNVTTEEIDRGWEAEVGSCSSKIFHLYKAQVHSDSRKL